MNTHGTAEVQLHLLTSTTHVGEWSSHAPRKQPPTPLSVPQTGVAVLQKRKPLAQPGIERRFLSRIASILVTTTAIITCNVYN
jgi:hypothetical protein